MLLLHRFAKSPSMKWLLPAAAISLAVIVAICGLLVWSAHEVDRISRSRDRGIVSLVLAQSMDRVAHIQESSTVWDAAVLKLRERPLDLAWLDINMGTWFSSYANHDEVYILSPQDQPLYAMRNGRRVDPVEYDAIRKAADPLIERLRHEKPATTRGLGEPMMLSPGAVDLAIIHGRAAIVSAKPVVTDSGRIPQRRGTEAAHLSIVYLNNEFIAQLSQQYGLANARFSFTQSHRRSEAALPMRTQDGRVIGYLIWEPFAPGEIVMSNVAPMLVAALLVFGLAVLLLTQRLYRRTIDLEVSKAQAQHLAMHDVLTGLPNRAMFEHCLEAALSRSHREGSNLALLYLDLDRFKQINDTLGHPAGDALIREVARRLTTELRCYDKVARLGGDEFAMIIANPADRSVVEAICARIIADLRRPFELMGTQSYVGASIGVAFAPWDGRDATELTRKADIALYKAKMDGRSRYALFSSDMDEAVRSREATDRELRKALADQDNQLKLLYQPVFSSTTGAMTAVEALLRWRHPERGLISPVAFISLAEQTGLIEELGDWVLRTAIRQAVQWPGLRVSINVSPIQVRGRFFVDKVLGFLTEAGLKPQRLQLEITESVLMEPGSEVAATLAALRSCGVSIALDDFGTGYSSLSYIRDLAVDRIKIDRSFITAIDTGRGAALVQAIITLAHASGLQLTAEGVETPRQKEFLEAAGCEELQGYLLSRPVSADEICALHSTFAADLAQTRRSRAA